MTVWPSPTSTRPHSESPTPTPGPGAAPWGPLPHGCALCRCQACVSSRWGCNWCVRQHLCTHKASCDAGPMVLSQQVSVTPGREHGGWVRGPPVRASLTARGLCACPPSPRLRPCRAHRSCCVWRRAREASTVQRRTLVAERRGGLGLRPHLSTGAPEPALCFSPLEN